MTTIYKYFVSYAHDSHKGSGFGWTTVARPVPVLTGDDIAEMAVAIHEYVDFEPGETIIILNFQLLSTSEEPQS